MADAILNINPSYPTIDVEESPIYQEVVELITTVLNRAQYVYEDARELLDEAINAINDANIAWLSDIPVDVPVKPDDINFTDFPVDINIGSVARPDEVILGNIDTNVTVEEPTKPVISFVIPPLPELPNLDDVPEPDLTFGFNEAIYTSELGDRLYQACLSELTNGSTGLTAQVESDIYARESERDLLELQNTQDRVANIWAESGMSMPSGALVAAINQVNVEYQNKYSDKSRDVRIESFKRADDNAKFIKNLSLQYEGVLRDYMAKYWERQLKAAEALLNSSIVYYDAMLKYQTIFVEQYKAEVMGYAAVIDGQSKAMDSEVKLYSAEVQYELGKADAKVKTIGAEVEVQKTQIAKGGLDVSVYDSDVKYELASADIKTKEISAELEKQKTAAAVYQAKTQMYAVESQFDLGVAKTKLDSLMANIEVLKLRVNSAIAAAGDISHVSATMAAGSISALNANASIGITQSISDNTSRSVSTNKAINFNPTGGYVLGS